MSKDLNAVILNKCATQCIMSTNINHHTLETFRGDLLLEHKLCLYFIEKRQYKISFFEIIDYYEIFPIVHLEIDDTDAGSPRSDVFFNISVLEIFIK